MRIDKREITRTEVVYIAFDGTGFDEMNLCAAYERENRDKPIIERASEIPHFSFGLLNIERASNDTDIVVVFKPRNMDDLQAIKGWAEICDYRAFLPDKDMINTRILFDAYSDYPWGGDEKSLWNITVCNYIGTYSDFKQSYNRHIDDMIEFGKEYGC